MNKSVTKYIFTYSSFHAEHDGHNYFDVKQLLRKLEGLLQPHVSLFFPPPSPVLSQYIPFYEVRRNIKSSSTEGLTFVSHDRRQTITYSLTDMCKCARAYVYDQTVVMLYRFGKRLTY